MRNQLEVVKCSHAPELLVSRHLIPLSEDVVLNLCENCRNALQLNMLKELIGDALKDTFKATLGDVLPL